MQPHLTVITLGVDDLGRALCFYRDGLGLPTPGIVGREFEHGTVVFIDLQAGLKLALWPRASMAHDTGVPQPPGSAGAVMLSHNVASPAEVAAVLQQAVSAGARLVKPAADTFWGGHAGAFLDLDGHLWEVAYNPALLPGADLPADGPQTK